MNNNYQKVYPSAPSAPTLENHQSPMARPVLNQQSGYVPKDNNGAFAPPVLPPNTGFPHIQNEPLFHIQPYPYPPPVNQHGPPPVYTLDNKIPVINPHNLPGGHQVTYIQGPSAYPKSAESNGYVPQSAGSTSSVVIDHRAFDSGARFNQGARPVIPPPPPGCQPTIHQIAAANGQQVILGKKKSNWWFQKGAGSVFW